MARTPLAQLVEETASRIADDEGRVSRRRLLQGAGASVVGASLLGKLAQPAAAARRDGPRIVVIGAGLAGLTAAYRISQAGLGVDVYEASSRIGGRCWTGRGDFADGPDLRARRRVDRHGPQGAAQPRAGARARPRQPAEGGAERARRCSATSPASRYTVAQMTADFQAVLPQMSRGRRRPPSYPTLYNSYTQRGLRARSHVDLRLHRALRPRRSPLAARRSCSTTPTTSSTAPRRRVQSLAQPALPARVSRDRTRSHTFGASEREVPHPRRQRPDADDPRVDGSRARSRRTHRSGDQAAQPTARYKLTFANGGAAFDQV